MGTKKRRQERRRDASTEKRQRPSLRRSKSKIDTFLHNVHKRVFAVLLICFMTLTGIAMLLLEAHLIPRLWHGLVEPQRIEDWRIDPSIPEERRLPVNDDAKLRLL